MTGDMGEMFNDMKKARQEKRASNREQSPQLLVTAGIPFEEKNMGAHLIVEGNSGYIDFWPGTGRWKERKGSQSTGFGVKNLIRFIQKNRPV